MFKEKLGRPRGVGDSGTDFMAEVGVPGGNEQSRRCSVRTHTTAEERLLGVHTRDLWEEALRRVEGLQTRRGPFRTRSLRGAINRGPWHMRVFPCVEDEKCYLKRKVQGRRRGDGCLLNEAGHRFGKRFK